MDPDQLGGVRDFAPVATSTLGLAGVPNIRVETASSSGAAVFTTAYSAVASGQYRRVLAVAAEKMTGLPTRQVTRVLAGVIDPHERDAGLTMPAMAALVTRAYAARLRLSEPQLKRVLSTVAIKAHANGALNPTAHFQKPITVEQYESSKNIAEPLNLYDCSPISDGAVAAVLTSEPTDIRVAGLGQGTDFVSLSKRQTLTSFPATVWAAQRAFKMAGYGPGSVHFAEVHDAFTSFELIALQDLGLVEPEDVVAAEEEGRTALHGPLPINPSGGLKAHGHPVGATGLGQIVEVVWQMRGQVDARRQVERTGLALTHSIGGPGSNNFVVLLESLSGHPAGVPVRGDVAGHPPAAAGPAPAGSAPSKARATLPKKKSQARGTLETFTVLHVPPEHLPSPIVLGLVGVRKGARILARGLLTEHYQLGEKVRVTRERDGWTFRRVPRLVRPLFDATKKAGTLLRRLRRSSDPPA
jgi:acetyl-CoA acetyltransferase